MPVLGILAEDPRPIKEVAAAIEENDHWLKSQKGFGTFSMINRTHRLLYAALLTQKQSTARTFSEVLNEQVAILA